MSVNNMNFEQAATILKSIADQATGTQTLTATNTSDFISVAQTALKGGVDPVLSAISQVLQRTIMSIRPYTAKLRGMEYSEREWGSVVRKLTVADKDPIDNDRWKYPVAYDAGQNPPTGNGQSVDQWIISKPDVMQTNFYGFDVWGDELTIFEEQLHVSFQNPEEFANFWSMIYTSYSNKHEQYYESWKRMTLANFIASLIDENNSNRIVHLLTEYNTLSGQSLTATSVWQSANFKPFMQFVYSKVAELSSMFTERSEMFQTVINSKHVMRHTPVDEQRIYLLAPIRYRAEMMAIADVYHDNYLRMADTETLNFWQAIDTPDSINMLPVYTDTNGAVYSPNSAVSQSNVFGVIADRNAFGVAELDRRARNTGMNMRGGYSNIWFSSKLRASTDVSEKGVVLLLD